MKTLEEALVEIERLKKLCEDREQTAFRYQIAGTYQTSQVIALKKALSELIDATEDKGGQLRAWHNHLRETPKNAKQLIQ